MIHEGNRATVASMDCGSCHKSNIPLDADILGLELVSKQPAALVERDAGGDRHPQEALSLPACGSGHERDEESMGYSRSYRNREANR